MHSSSNQSPYQHGDQRGGLAESSSTRAPASAIEAIMARLGLAREGDEPAGDSLTLARDLTDPSWKIRIQATQRLGKIGKQAPLELLLVALNDPHGSVRAAAARALGRNPRPAALSALVKALGDQEWVVRAEAALALGQMGEGAPLEALLAATRDQDAAVRAAAHQALGEIGSENALEPLDMALQDEDWSVREAATLALGRLDEQTALPALLDARQDRDAAVRKAAETILRQFHPESFASLPAPSDSFAQWLERIRSPQRYLASSEEQFAGTSIYTWHGQGRTPLARPTTREKETRQKPLSALRTWSRRVAHLAEGLLAAGLIVCLLVAWLVISSQTRTTPVQVGSSHASPAFTTYRGHDSSVEDIAWSPDGQTIASADTRGTVRVWQASTGHTLQTYPHLGRVLALTWSSLNVLLVAYAEPNQSLQVQQYTVGPYSSIDLLFQQTNLAAVPSVAAWASDNQTLAFDAGDGVVRIWNIAANLNITSFQEKRAQYTELSWSPDNNQIAALSATGQVQLWDAYSGQHIATLENDQSATLVIWVSSSQKSSELLFTGINGSIMRWWYNYSSQGQKIYPFLTKQTYNIASISYLSVSALALSPDKTQLLLATSDGLVQARDALSGNLIYTYTGHSAQVNDIRWGPDRQHIATASMDTTVQIWQEQ